MTLRCVQYSLIVASILYAAQDSVAENGVMETDARDCRIQAEFADGKADERISKIDTVRYWNAHTFDDAMSSCIVAELKKRAGQYDAVKFYKEAIEKNSSEPGYNIFLGDYYRNYRGPGQPLFDESRREYEMACQKLGIAKCKNSLDLEEKNSSWQKAELDRGLVYLYERDGIPLLYTGESKTPLLFLSFQTNYMDVTSDSDERDDVREFTSEAMLIESRMRNPPRTLSLGEQMVVPRTKRVMESLARIRVRHYRWPVIDLFYRSKRIENAQITDYDARSDVANLKDIEYNPLVMGEYGFSLEKLIGTGVLGDYSIKALFSRISRKGLIEDLADAEESIDNFETTIVGSRFFGRRKLDVEISYVYQDITQKIDHSQRRDRLIAAIRIDYHLGAFMKKKKGRQLDAIAYDRRFSSRGVTFFGGMVTDKERWGFDNVINNNYFIGGSWKGMRPAPSMNVFDATLQATVFSSDVQEKNPGMDRDNSQRRVGITITYRKIDEETNPWPPKKEIIGIPFSSLHYIVNLSSDTPLSGRNYYENRSIGLMISGKVYSRALRSTILGTVGVDLKEFTQLQTTEVLGSAKIGIGF